MALKQKTIKIGPDEFIIQTLPASKGIEAAVVLSHIMAGAAEGIGPTKIDFYDTDINFGAIAAGLLKRLSVQGTPIFIKDLILLSVIRPELDSEGYEIMFAGEYEKLCDLVGAILEHNGFIDLVKKKSSQIMALLSEPGTTGQDFTP